MAEHDPGQHSDSHLLLTYAELGARLGLSADSARVRARRKTEAGEWELVRPNGRDGLTRVRLPTADVPDSPPEHAAGVRAGREDGAGRLAAIEADVSELRVRVERTREVESGLRAELAEARTQAAVAEALLEAERAAGRELRASWRGSGCRSGGGGWEAEHAASAAAPVDRRSQP
jgi:hypothetical protein